MTIMDIANMAGVSPSTVSNVLNGRKNVGDETRKKVIQLCRDNGYEIEKKSTRIGSDPRTILFIFSDFDRKFYLEIIHGISDYVYSKDYDMIVSTTKSCSKFMDAEFTSGAIVLDRKCEDDILSQKAENGYRIVTLDRMIPSQNIKSVIVNNYTPMSEMVQGLVEMGYEKYAYLAGPDTLDNRERFQAFRDVLEKNRVTFRRENYLMGDFSEKSGYRAAKLMLLAENIPDVLVCANDNMAVGAMEALREEHINIPEDIAITGFDGTEKSDLQNLTTVDIPRYEEGYLAAQFLIQNLIGKGDNSTFRIAAKVKWRGTTAKKKVNNSEDK